MKTLIEALVLFTTKVNEVSIFKERHVGSENLDQYQKYLRILSAYSAGDIGKISSLQIP